ncbi:MAG: hypothetical protein GXY51_01315 [Bacteroidetes bacterium]|jgi:ankyrin repeat protein|nr:hypothetical protein [Bacteroidota bacterium]
MSFRFFVIALILASVMGIIKGQVVITDTSGYLPYFYEGALDYNLMIASSLGYDNEIKRLVNKGANVDAETMEGATPLFFAVSGQWLNAVNALIRYGADPDAETFSGETPLILAARLNNTEIAETLIRSGANTDHQDVYGATALHYASVYNYFVMTDLLLYYEADIDVKSGDSTTPLMAAVWAGNVDITDLLMLNGANLEARDNNGFTPFLIAAQNGDTLIMKLLMENGVDMYEKNIYNWDALSLSIRSDQKDAVEMLLKSGDKWNNKGRQVTNPYEIAAEYRRKEILDLLKDYNIQGYNNRRFNQAAVSLSTRFTFDNIYTGFSFSFKEPLSNIGILAGFDTKPFYTSVLVKESENTYYQYKEKSSFIYAGLFRDFNLTDNMFRSNLYFSTSLSAGYFFAENFKGTEIIPEGKFKIAPSASLKWNIRKLTIYSGVELVTTDYHKSGSIWVRTGCSINFLFSNIKTPAKTIRWY